MGTLTEYMQFYRPDVATDDSERDFFPGMVENADKADAKFKQHAGDLNSDHINVLYPPAPLVAAKGDGVTDDTQAIQNIINDANANRGRRVRVPKGHYLISASIVLNGCTLIGDIANFFTAEKEGTCFVAATKDFIAIRQGSTNGSDIQFEMKDIYVKNALVGFEINYVINSHFLKLYARDCDTAYKMGDLTSVGSMFNKFENFMTGGCRVGVMSQSKEFFNNNEFKNGYIQGNEVAFHMEVSGGYGAINNVFNQVELKSEFGRGLVLQNVTNLVMNNPYFECGGNAIRALDYCTITLNEPVFGMFKAANTNADTSFLFAEGGIRLKINGSTLILTSENDNTYLYDAVDATTYQNIYLENQITKIGSAVNFNLFKQPVNEAAYQKEEQAVTTSTITINAGTTTDVTFTYPEVFSRVPDVVSPTMRGVSGSGVDWVVSERLATGGTITVHNNSAAAKSLSFSIYAKIL